MYPKRSTPHRSARRWDFTSRARRSAGWRGRLGVSLVTAWLGWRWGLGVVAVAGLVMAEAFRRLAPASRGFAAREPEGGGTRTLLRDGALPWLWAEGFLLMGVFVTVYNYAAFRLMAPPYALGHAAVGAIFLLYILGSWSSAWFGALAGRRGRRVIFPVPVVLLIAGAALTAARPLWLVIAGVAVVTVGFFGAHSIASAWVGRRAGARRGQAAALYLFFYYLGSSVLGSAGGIAWSRGQWPGVALFCGVLALAALAVAFRLRAIAPLATEPAPAPTVREA